MPTVGNEDFTYQVIESWGRLPADVEPGPISDVAVDSKDRILIARRASPPLLALNCDGDFLSQFGEGLTEDPHGISIGSDDEVYVADRASHTVLKFSSEGELRLRIGTPGRAAATGCSEPGGPVPRPAGPFNLPTKLVAGPTGELFVSDGYCNARVHHFDADGVLQSSWGGYGDTAPGDFHLPHSIAVDVSGLLYVCDRENSRIQIFTPAGEFVAEWTDVFRPTDIHITDDGIAYISELRPSISVFDTLGVLHARWKVPPSAHGISADSHGNLYLAHVRDAKITKYLRTS